MLHLVTCQGSTATSAEAADDCPKRAVKKNLIKPEEASVLALSSGESSWRVGGERRRRETWEEPGSFVGEALGGAGCPNLIRCPG